MQEHEQSRLKQSRFHSQAQVKTEDETAGGVREFDPVADANTRAGARVADVHGTVLRRTISAQGGLARNSILRLQRTYGNSHVQRVLALVRKREAEAEVAPDVESAIEGARGGGQSLDQGLRHQMESAFGADFSGVRIHTGGEAHSLNRAVNAIAFTTGRDIFFREGAYDPESRDGQELLAHELTHVIQQNAAPAIPTQAHRAQVQRKCPACEEEQKAQARLTVSQPQDADEVEAEETARTVVGILNSSPRQAGNLPQADPQVNLHLAVLDRGLQLAQQENNPAAIELLERSQDLLAAQPEHARVSSFSVLSPKVSGGGCSCGGHCPKCRARQLQRQRTSHSDRQPAAVARQTLARDDDGGQRTTLQCINHNLSNAGIPWAVITVLGAVCGVLGGLAGLAGGPAAPATAPSAAAVAAAACIAGVTGLAVGTVLGVITRCIQDPSVEWVFAEAETGGSSAGEGQEAAA